MSNADATLTAAGSEGSHIIGIGKAFYIHGLPDIKAFRAIRTGTDTGNVMVSLEGIWEICRIPLLPFRMEPIIGLKSRV